MSQVGGKCPGCAVVSPMVEAGLPGPGIIWECPACSYKALGVIGDEDIDLEEFYNTPGMTVGQLRAALEGLPDGCLVAMIIDDDRADVTLGSGVLETQIDSSAEEGKRVLLKGVTNLPDPQFFTDPEVN